MATSRHSFTVRAMAYFKDRPLVWIPAVELEQFGRQAWRTRISEARQRFEAANDGTIENRVLIGAMYPGTGAARYTISEYRYVPASTPEPTTQASEPHNPNAFTLR